MGGSRFTVCFFFFQAEHGIRDLYVTGVQTCALPICSRASCGTSRTRSTSSSRGTRCCRCWCTATPRSPARAWSRSEERRVGKECRCRGSRDHEKKKKDAGEGLASGCEICDGK